MIQEIETLMNDYTLWLKDKTVLKEVDNSNWVEITTPFLDRHNDCLQIYVRKNGDVFDFTDDGYTITDLINSGCALDTPKKQELLKTTLSGFGVKTNERQELTVSATQEDFSLKKHNLIQAILATNDLFYLASTYVVNLFVEEVMRWLDRSDIRYTPNVKFTGKSGFDHMFGFVIPKSSKKPERVVHALSSPNKDTVKALVFRWMDTKEVRPGDSELYTFLNDNTAFLPSVAEALENYNLHPIPWSEREKVREELAA